MTIHIPAWVEETLVPVEKLEVHRLGLRHMAVSVFVLRGEEVLLQRRAMGKYHTPGLWANTCCTHPDWNEAPRDCATRRLREELGVTGLTPNFRKTVEYRAEVGNDMIEHEVVDIFVADATADLEIAPDPSEVMETRWVLRGALEAWIRRAPSDFTPWMRIYLERYTGVIFG
ncbi:isopentenyl-diphosphate delta-isomerase [Allosediminivita pacifica]|uniref:Isopentenyl-diphosphate Delta-isomerase n=1 Tax=Allosediminivita pacifica TaxID=1267769 RepID=A0A2T6B5S5_9RHOB|nr:isopentenyl-diphosphate delta-isomerase [Allosediminivita pacifica]PTX51392.1 isopentenyl-diphosphate delta-isomerase [Allosediminivita pacifica]GGA99469.1 isopentenyl-diphosphate Delta-isomerase [Allosediminivita pacifica]